MAPSMSFSYQWKRDSIEIPGATSAAYTVQAEDEARAMTCTVTASAAGLSAHATTAPSAAVSAPGLITPAAAAAFPIGLAIGNDPAVLYGSDHGLAQYEAMRSYGFTTVRIDAGYQTGGPSGNDRTIRAALAAGLDVLILIDGYDITIGAVAFAIWCRSVAETYGPLGVHHYEVLNEENYFGNWDRSPARTVSATGYVALLTAAYAAIKAADPSATVLLGGMACVSATDGAALGDGRYAEHLLPTTFITLVYAALGGSSTGAFDGVAVHPYTFPNNPGTTGDNFMNNLAPTGTTVRTVMVANGDRDKALWITEFGAPTGTDAGYTALTRAEQSAQLSSALTHCAEWDYVAAFYVFNWNDGRNDGDFGLVDVDYVPKPALAQVVAFIGAAHL
jgi:hypothetical protein